MKDYGLGPLVEGKAWFNQNVQQIGIFGDAMTEFFEEYHLARGNTPGGKFTGKVLQ